jgi:hypothetical protein
MNKQHQRMAEMPAAQLRMQTIDRFQFGWVTLYYSGT